MIRALNYWQIDLALTKETKLTERVAMEFAVQAFKSSTMCSSAIPARLNLVYDPTAAARGNLTRSGKLWDHQLHREFQQQQRQRRFPEHRDRAAAAASIHGSLQVLRTDAGAFRQISGACSKVAAED